MTLVVGPNSAGNRLLAETPDPFGPRNRPQSSGSGASAAIVVVRISAAANVRIMVLDHNSVGYSSDDAWLQKTCRRGSRCDRPARRGPGRRPGASSPAVGRVHGGVQRGR